MWNTNEALMKQRESEEKKVAVVAPIAKVATSKSHSAVDSEHWILSDDLTIDEVRFYEHAFNFYQVK